MDIGVIGLGLMGRAFVQNFLRAGHRVIAYNRTRSRAEELQSAGAQIADAPADACKGQVVITCLADDRAVEAVVFGEKGVAAALTADCVHISMSTLSLGLIERLVNAHSEAGQRFITAPVFGRPDMAAAGHLLVVASGDGKTLAQCQPVFDALGQKTMIVGTDSAAAALVKLVGNFLLVSAVESLSEATALLRKSGVEPQICLNALTSTLFAAPVYKNYSGLILQQNYDPGFRLALGLKDVDLILAAAESLNSPLPTANLLRARLFNGIARGYQNKDLAALALVCAEDSGLIPGMNNSSNPPQASDLPREY